MTEEELYKHVVALREEADKLLECVLDMPPTVALCVFTGKLSAVYDILTVMEDAGVPVHGSNEDERLLSRSP